MVTERKSVKSDFFGEARLIDIQKDALKNRTGEIFFSIHRRGADNKYIAPKDYGYLVKTDEMEKFIYHNFFYRVRQYRVYTVGGRVECSV